MIEPLIFTIILLFAIGFFTFNVRKLIKFLLIGKATDRFSNISERLKGLFVFVFGQKRLFQDLWPGIAHFIIFWGFIVISIGTVETLISGIFHNFSLSFLGNRTYGYFLFLHDLMYFLVTIACLYALYRRFVIKPARLGNTPEEREDASHILGLILLLMVTGYLDNGLEIRAGRTEFIEFMPFSETIANYFTSFDQDGSFVLHRLFFYVHIFILLYFLNYLPYSKHLHILSSLPNVFFRSLKSNGEISSINLEDESLTSFGASRLNDFSWKDLLDSYSCTECGRCQDECPAHNTDKPLSPKNIIKNLRKHLKENGSRYINTNGKEVDDTIIDKSFTEDELWACTTCRACQEACPLLIEHIEKILNMRRHLVLMESRFPKEVQTTFKGWETNQNPWSMGQSAKGEWSKNLDVKTVHDEKNFEYLYYAGCANSLDARNVEISKSIVKILKAGGINFAILGGEEKCCGETARRIGNEYLGQMMMRENIESFKNLSVKKIITGCPHCYNTLKNEYPSFGGNFDVYHHSEIIESLIRSKKISIKNKLDARMIYHDSCYLGRYNEIYSAPRFVIDNVTSKRIEAEKNKKWSFCCGAGGGRMWMEERIGTKINMKRTGELLSQNPDLLVTACPYCMTMLSDGIKATEREGKARVNDLAEIVAANMGA